MNAYLNYLLEVSVCLVLLYLSYHFFLRPLTFYSIRRFFLIVTVLLSFGIPALDFTVSGFNPPMPAISLPDLRTNNEIAEPNESQPNVLSESSAGEVKVSSGTSDSVFTPAYLFAGVYFLGMLVMLLKLLAGIVRIFHKVYRSKRSDAKHIRIHSLPNDPPAFSFFNYIFINPKALKSPDELSIVIDHEAVHMKQKHSFDLLFFEVAKIALWFHPLIYFMKKEIERVHEYTADEKSSMAKGKTFYSQILLNHARHLAGNNLAHSFAQLPLRYRIRELFRERSKKVARIRLVFTLPIVAILVLIFGCAHDFDSSYSIFPNGKRIKSIKVVYHDEYGDMPQYDGKYYSWAKFDRSGEIIDLKKGSLHENVKDEEKTVLTNPNILPTNTLWFLDYHSYVDIASNFFDDPENFVKTRIESARWLDKHNNLVELKVINNEKGMPVEISTTYPTLKDEHLTRVGPQIETFRYNSEDKLIKWVRSSPTRFPDGKEIEFLNTRTVEYNFFGKVSRVIADELTFDLTYDEKGNISEVSMDGIKYTFFYDEFGIRTHSFAYNADGGLEYRLDYEYEFY